MILYLSVLILTGFGLLFFVAFLARVVVPTNQVHIVQSRRGSKSYGVLEPSGNVYYGFHSSLPVIGVSVSKFSTAIIDIPLWEYEAYDQGRLPFVIDVRAFFRVSDPRTVTQRVSTMDELKAQLVAIVQGAARTILASHDLEQIMQGRSLFGQQFTEEVQEQLKNWGIETVKNIELMDIRDANGSLVIHNIMEKKKSLIESQSKKEVAKNKRDADLFTIEAKQQTDLRQIEATQVTNLRQTESHREVAIAQQKVQQNVNQESLLTKEKELALVNLDVVKNAQIVREKELIEADQKKAVQILQAEAALEMKRREAEAISLKGSAEADARKAMELAPVFAQIELAEKIGQNESYQNYLTTLRQIEAQEKVGIEQASALEQAKIKIIVTGDSAGASLQKVGDLFSSRGGAQLANMAEAFLASDAGEAISKKIGLKTE